MNADVGTLAYVTTSAGKSGVEVDCAGFDRATVLTSEPLWQNWPDGSGDGLVNGYRAAATNQVSTTR